MISIITADIIRSRKLSSKDWITGLKKILNIYGKSPTNWEIYRGDEFQLEISNPEASLSAAILIKSYFKMLKLDVRISIGFGEKSYKSKKISESNGTAFSRSGEIFETLKKNKINLAVNSDNEDFNIEMNLILQLSATFMDNWLIQSAEFIKISLENPDLSQEEIGLILGINQAAVSRRRKRSHYDLMIATNNHFRAKVKKLMQ